MKLLVSRITILLATALFFLISSNCASIIASQIAPAQDDAKQIAELDTVLRTGTTDEKRRAITQLANITSEKASELLLKTLKYNLENKRGYYVEYGSNTTAWGMEWTYVPSENNLLVEALGRRKYKKALPTLRKMFTINEKWLGFSKDAVAANIYLITSQPVKYYVDGEFKIYPEPEFKTDGTVIIGSLRSPSSAEAAWQADSLNSRLKELVRFLGDPGGPAGSQDHYFRTLKEEIGLKTLMSLVTSGDPLVRPYAVEALGILGERSDEVIPLLTNALRDKDPRMRFRSVRALGRLLASDNKPEEVTIMISSLKSALTDTEAEVRLTAALQFSRYAFAHRASMDPAVKDVVPLLVSALTDRVSDVRRVAASALGEIGPLTDQVLPSLIQLLKSKEKDDRESAAQALRAIPAKSVGDDEEREQTKKVVARALLSAVNDPAKDVRYAIAEGLGEAGPVVPGVIPALIKLTRDPSHGVRYEAAQSLGRFELDRARIVPALARMLNVEDENAEVVESALRALQEIGPDASSAVPEVRKLLKSQNPRLREYAGYALEKIEASVPKT